MQIVNGYVCQTSCDVSAARAGHDPKNPRDDPVKAAQLAEQKALASGKPVEKSSAARDALSGVAFAAESVTFGGNLASQVVPRVSPAEAPRLVDRLA